MWLLLPALASASTCIDVELPPDATIQPHDVAASDVVVVGIVDRTPPGLRRHHADAVALIEAAECDRANVLQVVVTEVLADRVDSALAEGHRVAVIVPSASDIPALWDTAIWHLDLVPSVPPRVPAAGHTRRFTTPPGATREAVLVRAAPDPQGAARCLEGCSWTDTVAAARDRVGSTPWRGPQPDGDEASPTPPGP